MSSFGRGGCILLAAFLTLAGCSTIASARKAQRFFAPRVAGAGDRPGRVDLSGRPLSALVDFALTNRPSMISASIRVLDERLALREIAADAPLASATPWTAPHLMLSGGHQASSLSAHRLKWRTDGNASAGLSLDLLIYDFGRNEALSEAERYRLVAAEYDFIAEGYRVFEEVSSAYFTLMEKDALLAVSLTNEVECALRFRQAEDRFEAGEAKRLDVTAAKLDYSQSREAAIVASNAVVQAGAEMMKALGIDASRGTRDEVLPPQPFALDTVVRGFARTDYGLEAAFALARTNAPAMAVARATLAEKIRLVDYAVADMKPSIAAEVGINWADPLWVWHWGVNGVQSVFEGFRKTTKVDRAVLAMNDASAKVDEAEQQLSLELEKAVADRDNARKALETARDSVANALENLNTAKAQFREGDVSRVDFTIAITKYATALGSRVSAFYAEQIAEARLFALVGRVPEYHEGIVGEGR